MKPYMLSLVFVFSQLKLIAQGGVNNLLDRNYALMEGFPEAGRNYFLNLAFTHY
ncbi:hypothetical protein [Cecembia calidifontis]|jgi:outer membrane cobalamin receptor|uniref:hypothetical protein n=1 Tax=Cecembia calidifontis TaxID=1187080 RepID=UPI0013EE4972|nr:hypothetical protein [Cecembia calidifontis]